MSVLGLLYIGLKFIKTLLNRFSRKIRQTTWFRARMCFFGVRNKNL